MPIRPKDVIAFLVILGYFTSKYLGFDSQMDAAFMLILGYYFVKRVEKKDNGQ